jgi:hypothetical protein
MDHYPYATLRANRWFHHDGLYHPGFPTLLQDVLHYFGYTRTPVYYGRLYHEFGHAHYKVHVHILTHPTNPSMTAWVTTAEGDDLDNTLERAAHQALMEFCECHQSGLNGTAVALFPIWNEGNAV